MFADYDALHFADIGYGQFQQHDRVNRKLHCDNYV